MKRGSYIIRLDDACERRDIAKWDRFERLLDEYNIKPLVGMIPECKDPQMEKYAFDEFYWKRVKTWHQKGWELAMHGYQHIYDSNNAGINPVNQVSEFAGHSLDRQREKVRLGYEFLKEHGVQPTVFFAPSHTFDTNTLEALKIETDIRIISDTPAWKPYRFYGFTFVPVQSGSVRSLPFKISTFCYHPNTMEDGDWNKLQQFLEKHSVLFTTIAEAKEDCNRKPSVLDKMTNESYFLLRKARKGLRDAVRMHR